MVGVVERANPHCSNILRDASWGDLRRLVSMTASI
jgi:hypothetical protein